MSPLYSAMCDIFADNLYKGTIVLNSFLNRDDAQEAAELWFDYPVMRLISNFYQNDASLTVIVPYVKQVI